MEPHTAVFYSALPPPRLPRQSSSERAFTLIELSIVLVVIGLLVGGVLVGRDLIETSKLQATASQLQKYNQAVNTFRDKFGGIPGDLSASLSAATMNGQNGYYWGINRNSSFSPTNKYDYAILSDTSKGVVTPAQALAFDIKIDDGFPTTGNVYAVRNIGDNHIHPFSYSTNCVANTTPLSYNTTYIGLACGLWVNRQ